MPKYEISIYQSPSGKTDQERVMLALEHIARVLSVQTQIMIDENAAALARKRAG